MANTHSVDLDAGSSQYAYITDANQTGLDLSGDFTIEAWVKVESAPASGNDMGLFTKYNNAVGERAYQFFYTNDTGTLKINITVRDTNDSTTDAISWTYTLPLGVWTHIAVVADIGTNYTLYVNGISQGTSASSVSTIQNSPAAAYLGALQSSGSPVSYFDGLIDELRVWDDIRTAQEITDYYGTELVGNEAGLVGYWKFNNSALDETSNNNDLTLSGSPVYSTTIPFINNVKIFYPDANVETTSMDAYTRRGGVDESFATIIAGAGNLSGDTDTGSGTIIETSATSNQFARVQRPLWLFDTSELTSIVNLTTGKIYLYGTSKGNGLSGSPEYDIVSSNPASNTSVANSDYGTFGSTPYSSKAYADYSASGYNEFLLDSTGLATISKTGISKFGGKINWDTDASFGGSWASAQECSFSHYMSDNGNYKPMLVVEYTTESSSVSPSLSPSGSGSASESKSASPSGSESKSLSPSASPSTGYTGYSRGNYAELPANDDDLETVYSAQDVLDVASNDETRVGQVATGEYMIHQYKNFVGANTDCTLLWEGQSSLAPSASIVKLQIYNRDTPAWEDVDTDDTTGANSDFELTGVIADLTNYKSTSNVISCRIWQLAI